MATIIDATSIIIGTTKSNDTGLIFPVLKIGPLLKNSKVKYPNMEKDDMMIISVEITNRKIGAFTDSDGKGIDSGFMQRMIT